MNERYRVQTDRYRFLYDWINGWKNRPLTKEPLNDLLFTHLLAELCFIYTPRHSFAVNVIRLAFFSREWRTSGVCFYTPTFDSRVNSMPSNNVTLDLFSTLNYSRFPVCLSQVVIKSSRLPRRGLNKTIEKTRLLDALPRRQTQSHKKKFKRKILLEPTMG